MNWRPHLTTYKSDEIPIPKGGHTYPPSLIHIACPHCTAQELHHNSVETFFRMEDWDEGVYTKSTHDGVVSGTDLTGNPSPRRDGVVIRFWCEICDGKSKLCLIQHKGSTYMYWDMGNE